MLGRETAWTSERAENSMEVPDINSEALIDAAMFLSWLRRGEKVQQLTIQVVFRVSGP